MATALRETTRGVVRDARQAVADARDVAHHAAERLELEARRRPVAAAGVAATAGFLAGWLDGQPAEACLRLAVACGSLSVRASGGTDGQPERGEAEELAGRLETRPLASGPMPPQPAAER